MPLARLPTRDRRFLQVLPGRARSQQQRGGLVDLVGEGEIVEARLSRPAAASRECGPEFATPQDQLSSSIWSLCLSSIDSPLMSPSFAKMSDATTTSDTCSGAAGAPFAQARAFARTGQGRREGAGQPAAMTRLAAWTSLTAAAERVDHAAVAHGRDWYAVDELRRKVRRQIWFRAHPCPAAPSVRTTLPPRLRSSAADHSRRGRGGCRAPIPPRQRSRRPCRLRRRRR